MRLPFIEHTGIGIHITDRVIRWAELRRIRHHIKVVHLDSEPVTAGDPQAALERLTDRIQSGQTYVSAAIDTVSLWEVVLNVPYHYGEQSPEKWLVEARRQLLTDEADAAKYAISHHLFGNEEEGRKCLFLGAREGEVAAWIRQFEGAGLTPLALTGGGLESGYGMLFDDEFTNGYSWLLAALEREHRLILYRDGVLQEYYSEFGDSKTTDVLLQEAERVIANHHYGERSPSAVKLYLLSVRERHDAKQGLQSSYIQVMEGVPLPNLFYEGEPVPEEYFMACGLAVKQLYPDLDTLNLLGEDRTRAGREELMKKDTVVTGSLLGSILIVLFLLASWLEWSLQSRGEVLDAQVARLEDNITAVTTARQQVDDFTAAIAQARTLLENRSYAAEHAGRVGRSLPDRLWLTELEMKARSMNNPGYDVMLTGFSRSEEQVYRLLENLERQESLTEIRLTYSEKVDRNRVYEGPRYRDKHLVKFHVQLKSENCCP